MGYPGQGLCQSLIVTKTSSGITGWLLQGKHLRHWIFSVSEQEGMDRYGLNWFCGPCLSNDYTAIAHWLQRVGPSVSSDLVSCTWWGRKCSLPTPGYFSPGFALHRTLLKWVSVLGLSSTRWILGCNVVFFEMVRIGGIHQVAFLHPQKPRYFEL